MKKRLYFSIPILAGLILAGLFSSTVKLARASSFDPNRIIDDNLFIALTTMHEADIAKFLNDRGGLQKTEPSRLKSAGRKASEVIHAAGLKYGLNPQVILATLQKEQSLVASSSPSDYQLDFAMGFGVYAGSPYIDPSNSLYAGGFATQVEKGAEILKARYDSSLSTNGCRVGDQCPIQNSSSDSKTTTITISNRATASLYSYTPYLSGNRSFYNLFTGWFEIYSAELVSQEPYQGFGAFDVTVPPGEQFELKIRLRNTGGKTWQREGQNPVRLGVSKPRDGQSLFGNRATRVAYLNQDQVGPGEIGSFSFFATAPEKPGLYTEFYGLLAEGLYWFGPEAIGYTIPVGGFNALPYAKGPLSADGKIHLQPGQTTNIWLQFYNTGSAPWIKEGRFPVKLGTDIPRDRRSVFLNGSNRAGSLNESVVNQNQVGAFEFPITAPLAPGSYQEILRPLAEGYSWFGTAETVSIVVEPFQAAFHAQSGGGWADPIRLKPGEQKTVWVQYRNTGIPTWRKVGPTPTKLGSQAPQDRLSFFIGTSNRTDTINEPIVRPGEVGSFEFLITAPEKPGRYRETFQPVAEGSMWFGPLVSFEIIVEQ